MPTSPTVDVIYIPEEPLTHVTLTIVTSPGKREKIIVAILGMTMSVILMLIVVNS